MVFHLHCTAMLKFATSVLPACVTTHSYSPWCREWTAEEMVRLLEFGGEPVMVKPFSLLGLINWLL